MNIRLSTYLFLFKIIRHKSLRKKIITAIARNDGGFMYSKKVREIYERLYKIKIGYGTYGGCFNVNHIPENTEFGNYCSIAKNVLIFRANHPLNEFTLHPLLYNPVAGYVESYALKKPKLVIGDDVWIGENTIILPNVHKIGMGAVLGAGSVITKDVEEFTVVAGNPAKFIKRRFPDEVVTEIKKTKWWSLSKEELTPKIVELRKLFTDKA